MIWVERGWSIAAGYFSFRMKTLLVRVLMKYHLGLDICKD